MAYPKVKGSIILKLLIVVSIAALAMAVYVPNQLWTLERDEENECHFRMLALTRIQTEFYRSTNAYADSVEKIMALADTNLVFRAICDSIIQVLAVRDTAECIKLNKPFRMYWDVPGTIDSMYRCPSNGEFYTIEVETAVAYKIFCPEEPDTIKVYSVFERIFVNHGQVNHAGDTSWK